MLINELTNFYIFYYHVACIFCFTNIIMRNWVYNDVRWINPSRFVGGPISQRSPPDNINPLRPPFSGNPYFQLLRLRPAPRLLLVGIWCRGASHGVRGGGGAEEPRGRDAAQAGRFEPGLRDVRRCGGHCELRPDGYTG